jgi:hypothetical protein
MSRPTCCWPRRRAEPLSTGSATSCGRIRRGTGSTTTLAPLHVPSTGRPPISRPSLTRPCGGSDAEQRRDPSEASVHGEWFIRVRASGRLISRPTAPRCSRSRGCVDRGEQVDRPDLRQTGDRRKLWAASHIRTSPSSCEKRKVIRATGTFTSCNWKPATETGDWPVPSPRAASRLARPAAVARLETGTTPVWTRARWPPRRKWHRRQPARWRSRR